MRHARRNFYALTRHLPAVAFALWLAGAGCAFCRVTSAASAQPPAPASRHADAAPARAHCPGHARRANGADERRGRAATSVKASNPLGCRTALRCREARPASEQARNPRPADERPAAAAHGPSSPGDVASSHYASPRPRGRPPDERARHVRCCVFLI